MLLHRNTAKIITFTPPHKTFVAKSVNNPQKHMIQPFESNIPIAHYNGTEKIRHMLL